MSHPEFFCKRKVCPFVSRFMELDEETRVSTYDILNFILEHPEKSPSSVRYGENALYNKALTNLISSSVKIENEKEIYRVIEDYFCNKLGIQKKSFEYNSSFCGKLYEEIISNVDENYDYDTYLEEFQEMEEKFDDQALNKYLLDDVECFDDYVHNVISWLPPSDQEEWERNIGSYVSKASTDKLCWSTFHSEYPREVSIIEERKKNHDFQKLKKKFRIKSRTNIDPSGFDISGSLKDFILTIREKIEHHDYSEDVIYLKNIFDHIKYCFC